MLREVVAGAVSLPVQLQQKLEVDGSGNDIYRSVFGVFRSHRDLGLALLVRMDVQVVLIRVVMQLKYLPNSRWSQPVFGFDPLGDAEEDGLQPVFPTGPVLFEEGVHHRVSLLRHQERLVLDRERKRVSNG